MFLPPTATALAATAATAVAPVAFADATATTLRAVRLPGVPPGGLLAAHGVLSAWAACRGRPRGAAAQAAAVVAAAAAVRASASAAGGGGAKAGRSPSRRRQRPGAAAAVSSEQQAPTVAAKRPPSPQSRGRPRGAAAGGPPSGWSAALDALRSSVLAAPAEAGVYLFRDEANSLLYVGKSKTLSGRVRSYFGDLSPPPAGTPPPAHLPAASGLSPRIRAMVSRARSVEYVLTGTEAAALALEANLVRTHMPPYNVLLKDDRRYPYVAVTWSETYPRIIFSHNRRRDRVVAAGRAAKGGSGAAAAAAEAATTNGAPLPARRDRVYGPFMDAGDLRKVLSAIQRAFPLRQRPTPLHSSRPCINYDIGRCPGVCQELITPRAYAETVAQAEMVLQGRTPELLTTLEVDMWAASDAERYDDAATLRDRISTLRSAFATTDVARLVADASSAAAWAAVQGGADGGSGGHGLGGGQAAEEDVTSRDVAAVAVAPAHTSAAGLASVLLFQCRSGQVVNRFAFSLQAGARSGEEGGRRGRGGVGDGGDGGDDASGGGGVDVSDADAAAAVVAGAQPASLPLTHRVTASEVIRAGTLKADTSAQAVALQAALEQHYSQPDLQAAELPDELVTAVPLPDGPALAAFLTEKARRPVRVSVARRTTAALAGLALRNATMEVEFAARRHADADVALADLANLLADAFPDADPSPPAVARLEAYDISHTSGTAAVASRVVFIDGVPVPSLYRRYHLKEEGSSSLGAPNDFASMAEVLARRFSRSTGGDAWPDVVLIDGGKGQLSAAVGALGALEIDVDGAAPPFRVLSLAKREEEVFVPGQSAPVVSGSGLGAGTAASAAAAAEKAEAAASGAAASGTPSPPPSTSSPALLLLMRLRDEAHRHAVRSHRALRGRDATSSALAGVPGVGPAKRAGLLAHFGGSPEAVAAATEEQLTAASGVGPALAKSIYNHFHPEG